MEMNDVKKINLDDVVFGEVFLRQHKENAEHIKNLCDDLLERGLLNLPSVVPTTDGKYKIKDGARRLAAMKILAAEGKWPQKVSLQIAKAQSDLDTLADQIAGNAQVEKTATREYINALYTLCTVGEMPLADLSKKCGLSVPRIMQLFKTLKLPENVVKEAEAGKVSIVNMISLSDLAKKVPDDELLSVWVPQAIAMNSKEFSELCVNTLTELKKPLGQRKAVAEFKATKQLKKAAELEMMLIQAEQAFNKKATPENEIRLQVMREIFQIDEKTVAARRKAWEQLQADKKKKADERKAKRDEDKLAESIAAAEAAGYKLIKPKA